MDVNYMDMYRCHAYHFFLIYKPSVNKPIGSYQIEHLKCVIDRCTTLTATTHGYQKLYYSGMKVQLD